LIKKIFWSTIGGALIILPWLITIAPYSTFQNFMGRITTLPSQVSSFLTAYNELGNPLDYFPLLIWVSLPIIFGWALWRREKDFTTIFLWWYLIFLAANPQIFGLPGEGVMNNFSIQIALYIPFGIIIGATLACAIGGIVNLLNNSEWFSPRFRNILNITIYIIILASVVTQSFSQTSQRLDDIRPTQYALMTRPDERAMHWIQQNTSSADRFLVNSFFTNGFGLYAGSDGGWWLPLRTKRITTQPPLNYGDEEGLAPDYYQQVNDLIEVIEQKGLSDPDVLIALRERRVKYIYIGQQQGHVNSPLPLLDIKKIQKDSRFQLVYRQDQIWIFSITSYSTVPTTDRNNPMQIVKQ